MCFARAQLRNAAFDDEWVPGYASTNSRARGRFARNFVVQGSAADWALLVLAALRQSCADMAAELVFFQHDEVIVHCPEREAEAVVTAIREAAELAGRLTSAVLTKSMKPPVKPSTELVFTQQPEPVDEPTAARAKL